MAMQRTLGDYLTEGGSVFACCHCRKLLARSSKAGEIGSNLVVHCSRCHRRSVIPMIMQKMERIEDGGNSNVP